MQINIKTWSLYENITYFFNQQIQKDPFKGDNDDNACLASSAQDWISPFFSFVHNLYIISLKHQLFLLSIIF